MDSRENGARYGRGGYLEVLYCSTDALFDRQPLVGVMFFRRCLFFPMYPTINSVFPAAIPVSSLLWLSQVDMCLFDKTGTITSDKLLAETLIAPHRLEEDPDAPPVMVELAGNAGKRGDVSTSSKRSDEVDGPIVEPGLAAKVNRQASMF